MRNALFHPFARAACLSLWLVAATCHAEIYKWVDANGRTHFSERKNDASKAKALELKATTPPAADQPPLSPAEHWQEKERQFRQRQIENQNAKPQEEAAASKPPKSLSGGVEDGSDASRCNLARDVLSGAVRHGNGKPTDKYDREIAENDVRRYCR